MAKRIPPHILKMMREGNRAGLSRAGRAGGIASGKARRAAEIALSYTPAPISPTERWRREILAMTDGKSILDAFNKYGFASASYMLH